MLSVTECIFNTTSFKLLVLLFEMEGQIHLATNVNMSGSLFMHLTFVSTASAAKTDELTIKETDDQCDNTN